MRVLRDLLQTAFSTQQRIQQPDNFKVCPSFCWCVQSADLFVKHIWQTGRGRRQPYSWEPFSWIRKKRKWERLLGWPRLCAAHKSAKLIGGVRPDHCHTIQLINGLITLISSAHSSCRTWEAATKEQTLHVAHGGLSAFERTKSHRS